MLGSGVQNLIRAAAQQLGNLADRADEQANGIDPDWAAHGFAGMDFVGIDFSTSIESLASHVILGWDRYRSQMDVLRPDHGVWAFGVNCLPFPVTRAPVLPSQLPSFCEEHFQRKGNGRGLVEYGSAFYDYFRVALECAREWMDADSSRADAPVTISLLCDGLPNGGLYRADEVRPQIAEARARGVRFKLVVFVGRKYWRNVWRFSESVGLGGDDLELIAYDGDAPDGNTIANSFAALSSG